MSKWSNFTPGDASTETVNSDSSVVDDSVRGSQGTVEALEDMVAGVVSIRTKVQTVIGSSAFDNMPQEKRDVLKEADDTFGRLLATVSPDNALTNAETAGIAGPGLGGSSATNDDEAQE